MESKFNIYGKGLESEDKDEVAQGLETFYKEGVESIEGEIQKSPEALYFIEKINEYLDEELGHLKMDAVKIEPERIHILKEDGFKQQLQKGGASGIHVPLTNNIFIKYQDSRMQMYKSMLHEAIHSAAFKTYYADKEQRKINVMRGGYAVHHPLESEHEHFRGMNEAIVDKIVMDIFHNHKDELIKELKITDKEQNSPVNYYTECIDVLDVIIEKIAEANNEDASVVWTRFKKGEFSGEMMHLREIENVFGKGSLRVLGALRSGIKDSVADKGDEKILEYFQTENEADRDKIAKEILTERERLRYQKRRAD